MKTKNSQFLTKSHAILATLALAGTIYIGSHPPALAHDNPCVIDYTNRCPDQSSPPACDGGDDSTCPVGCPPGSNGPRNPSSPGSSPSPGCPACNHPNLGSLMEARRQAMERRSMIGGAAAGMPQFWVSLPTASLRIEDVPTGYQPSHGPRVDFHLSYRQRAAVPEEPILFGVGTNWSCSFRSYVIDMSSSAPGWARLQCSAKLILREKGIGIG